MPRKTTTVIAHKRKGNDVISHERKLKYDAPKFGKGDLPSNLKSRNIKPPKEENNIKKYKISLGVFEESGVSASLKELNDGGDWETMAFPDASYVVHYDERYHELDNELPEWDGEEFLNYAWGEIFELYNGYKLDNSDVISGGNTILESDTGEKYSFEELKKISTKSDYDSFYEKTIKDKKRVILKQAISYIESENLDELKDIEVEETVLHNFRANGDASDSLIELYEEEMLEEEEIISLVLSMDAAKRRHTETDYDSINKSGMSEDEVKRLRKSYNK